MDEIELKLEVSPEAAHALESGGLLPGQSGMVNQRSIYFDTPAEILAKTGLSLRIRLSDGKRIQTVKTAGANGAGLFARTEWESAVADDKPILDDTTPVRALIGDAVDDVAPLFEVQVTRRTWQVREGASLIELAVDRGEVVAGDRRAPLCEVELELKDGDPDALFAFARRIDAVAPVRLGVLSKAERGYRLTRAVRPAVKADPVILGTNMTTAQAFQHIVQTCMRHFRLNETLLLHGRDAPPLHQSRVALRRLRSAFTIFKPIVGGGDAAKLREELRWLSSELGDARNLDVMLEHQLSEALRAHLKRAREAAYDRVADILASSRARRLMLDLAEWTVQGDWLTLPETQADRDRPVSGFAVTALDRFRRKVKKDGRDLENADDEARHQVRKDAKKLRYASEFFEALFQRKQEKRRYKRFTAALEEVQDRLGRLNDLATVPATLEKVGIAGDPDAAALLGHDDRDALVEASAEALEELVDAKRFWR